MQNKNLSAWLVLFLVALLLIGNHCAGGSEKDNECQKTSPEKNGGKRIIIPPLPAVESLLTIDQDGMSWVPQTPCHDESPMPQLVIVDTAENLESCCVIFFREDQSIIVRPLEKPADDSVLIVVKKLMMASNLSGALTKPTIIYLPGMRSCEESDEQRLLRNNRFSEDNKLDIKVYRKDDTAISFIHRDGKLTPDPEADSASKDCNKWLRELKPEQHCYLITRRAHDYLQLTSGAVYSHKSAVGNGRKRPRVSLSPSRGSLHKRRKTGLPHHKLQNKKIKKARRRPRPSTPTDLFWCLNASSKENAKKIIEYQQATAKCRSFKEPPGAEEDVVSVLAQLAYNTFAVAADHHYNKKLISYFSWLVDHLVTYSVELAQPHGYNLHYSLTEICIRNQLVDEQAELLMKARESIRISEVASVDNNRSLALQAWRISAHKLVSRGSSIKSEGEIKRIYTEANEQWGKRLTSRLKEIQEQQKMPFQMRRAAVVIDKKMLGYADQCRNAIDDINRLQKKLYVQSFFQDRIRYIDELMQRANTSQPYLYYFFKLWHSLIFVLSHEAEQFECVTEQINQWEVALAACRLPQNIEEFIDSVDSSRQRAMGKHIEHELKCFIGINTIGEHNAREAQDKSMKLLDQFEAELPRLSSLAAENLIAVGIYSSVLCKHTKLALRFAGQVKRLPDESVDYFRYKYIRLFALLADYLCRDAKEQQAIDVCSAALASLGKAGQLASIKIRLLWESGSIEEYRQLSLVMQQPYKLLYDYGRDCQDQQKYGKARDVFLEVIGQTSDKDLQARAQLALAKLYKELADHLREIGCPGKLSI